MFPLLSSPAVSVPAMRRARLPAATLAALLVLAGWASPPEPRLAMPDSPLIDAQPGGDAAGRMADLARRGAQPAREPARDLGPLRMRETPARAPAAEASRQLVQPDSATRDTGERVELNFVDAELGAVVRALARFTGRNFVVDPRVKGQLTLVSEAPVSPPVAYSMLASALRMQGASAEWCQKPMPSCKAYPSPPVATVPKRADYRPAYSRCNTRMPPTWCPYCGP